mgnify:CR=1 FL=1
MFGDPVRNDKEWPTKPIKEVAPETNADIPKDNEYWWLNLDMIESYSGRLLDRVIEKSDAIGSSTHPFDDSMVLYSKLRPYLNKIFVPDSYGYATTELVALKPNPNELNKYFLFNLLRGDCFVNFANKSSSGAQMPRMQMKVLREFQCILPPMDLQNKFVEISEQADKSKFTGFKSQFIEMFGDPTENPNGWIKLTVKDAVTQGYIARPLDGNHGEKHPKGDDYVPEGVPFLMAQDLIDKRVDFNNCHFITEKQASTLKKGWAKEGDVLLTHKGTIGRVAIVQPSQYESMLLTPQITYYRCLKDIDNEYLAAYFMTGFFVEQLERLTTGTTRACVTITQQERLELIIPPVSMQRDFVKFVNQSDKSK